MRSVTFLTVCVLCCAFVNPTAAPAACKDDTKGVDLTAVEAWASKPDSSGNSYITVQFNEALDSTVTTVPAATITVAELSGGGGGGGVYTASIPNINLAAAGSCSGGGGWGTCAGACAGDCSPLGDDPGNCNCKMSPSGAYHGCRCIYPMLTASIEIPDATSGDTYVITLDSDDDIEEGDECNNIIILNIP